MSQTTAQPHHSPDGAWWWSGTGWLPAWSTDGAWWFDGTFWRPIRPRKPRLRLSRGEIGVAVGYVALWVAGAVWSFTAIPEANTDNAQPSTYFIVFGIAIVSLAALGVLGTSAWLAARGRWAVIGLLIAYVCAWVFTLYVAMMLAVPVPAGEPDTQDIAAGAGLFILFIPTVIIVVILAGIGTGIGVIWGARARHRASTRPETTRA